MMESQINKLNKVNIILIFLYFASTILAILQVNSTGKVLLIIVVSISTVFLLYINVKDLKYINRHKLPIYYYFFVIIVIITLYCSGSYNSILFPYAFLLPFLHSVINFSRREGVAITIFILASMWLILMGDIYLFKIYQVIFASTIMVFVQIVIELLKKEYKFNKKQSFNNCRACIKKNNG